MVMIVAALLELLIVMPCLSVATGGAAACPWDLDGGVRRGIYQDAARAHLHTEPRGDVLREARGRCEGALKRRALRVGCQKGWVGVIPVGL